jgi:hypothetical protein
MLVACWLFDRLSQHEHSGSSHAQLEHQQQPNMTTAPPTATHDATQQ